MTNSDQEVRRRKWENWGHTLDVCRTQVTRAVQAGEAGPPGECGLAIVAIATMLEAYINFWTDERFSWDEDIIPEHLRPTFKSLPVKDRYRLLMRFHGRSTGSKVLAFEHHEVHKTVEVVFNLRNKFVHGNLGKWAATELNSEFVRQLWNGAMDVLEAIETLGEFRIPQSRLEEYRAEIAQHRIGKAPCGTET